MLIHEAAQIFPELSGKDYEDLVNSIRENGLLKPIEIYEGKIIDGRNRYNACLDAGVIPKTVEIILDIDPYEYVWAVNAERRHLPPGQKVAIKLLQIEKSQEWREAQLARTQAANQARSEAARHKQRTDKGTFVLENSTGGLSHDKRLDKPTWGHIEVARSAEVSTATAARAQALKNKRPDLIEKVAAGKISLTEALRNAKKEELAEKLQEMPTEKYRVIYADPPWKYSDKIIDKYGAAEKHYPTMSIAELCMLPVDNMSEDNSVLFLWTTSPLLEDAFLLINSWGFKYKTSFVWDKIKHNYGHYNSVRHEFLLVATKGSCLPDNSKLFDSVVNIERQEHSKKPEEFYLIIETLYLHGKKIELFARAKRDGWESWGNET